MDALNRLIDLDAVARLRAHDLTLFGDSAEEMALTGRSLGWTRLARGAASELEAVDSLAEDLAEPALTDVVLLGMGGSSLASLVLGDLLGGGSSVRLHVLDTTCPRTVAATLEHLDFATSVVLVSSKSGGTIEPNSLYAVFRAAADAALGREAAGRRFVALTDPGSPLEALAASDGFRALVSTPADVGGRFSALTPFGLVPARLMGADVKELVSRGVAMEAACDLPTAENPAALLASFIHDAYESGSDKLTILASRQLRSFGLWIEQLVAESLGKEGKGIVPVVELSDDFPQGYGPDRQVVVLRLDSDGRLAEWTSRIAEDLPTLELTLRDGYDIAAQFSLWEHAVALLGPLMRVNPFGQPNVQSAKDATNAVLAGRLSAPEPTGTTPEGSTIAYAGGFADPHDSRPTLESTLGHALAQIRPGDYLCVLAYLPDVGGLLAPLTGAVPTVSAATGAAFTFELGPRYLHSTGQLHKGGPNTGVFVVITERDASDHEVPGRSWGLRTLFRAQAEGDIATLAAADRRVLHIDLPSSDPAIIDNLATALLDAAGVVWEA